MTPDLSQVPSHPVPRLLIAEPRGAIVDSLVRNIKDSRLDLNYEMCDSHDGAVIQLFRSPPPYQLVISNIRLAEIDNFLLLKHNQFRQPEVPFLITAGLADIELSRVALDKGAFDLIATPLESKQTVETIRLALWQNKLQALIASREKMLEKYRQIIADYPGDRKESEVFQSLLASMEKTKASTQRSLQRIEESLLCISNFAAKVMYQARKRALERLDALSPLTHSSERPALPP